MLKMKVPLVAYRENQKQLNRKATDTWVYEITETTI